MRAKDNELSSFQDISYALGAGLPYNYFSEFSDKQLADRNKMRPGMAYFIE